jgi:hypothetical protein
VNGELTLMQDGDVLRQAAGDRFQIYLTPATDMYVYVCAVDATAWIQRLYPDASSGHVNPVRAGQPVFLPGPGYSFGLDEYAGVQEIWFLASPHPRPDVEAALSMYPIDRQRPMSQIRSRSGEPEYARVSRASTFSRGLVIVGEGEPAVGISPQGLSNPITPERLFASSSAEEIAFSRWFQHQ